MTRRILIIDDEERSRKTLGLGLEAEGYEVATAASGVAGLAQFGTGDGWDLVLLDYRMPEMDGMEVLRCLRARNQSVPVLLLTAYGSIELTSKVLSSGARGFLTKPIMLRSLREIVRKVLEPVGRHGCGRGDDHGANTITDHRR